MCLKERFDKEVNENNDYAGIIFRELAEFKISHPKSLQFVLLLFF